MSYSMNTIEEALEDIKSGKIVIVVDDENRENEGDFVTAARNATPELINFMATHGRGLICTPLIEEKCDELGLRHPGSSHIEERGEIELLNPEINITGIGKYPRWYQRSLQIL